MHIAEFTRIQTARGIITCLCAHTVASQTRKGLPAGRVTGRAGICYSECAVCNLERKRASNFVLSLGDFAAHVLVVVIPPGRSFTAALRCHWAGEEVTRRRAVHVLSISWGGEANQIAGCDRRVSGIHFDRPGASLVGACDYCVCERG